MCVYIGLEWESQRWRKCGCMRESDFPCAEPNLSTRRTV